MGPDPFRKKHDNSNSLANYVLTEAPMVSEDLTVLTSRSGVPNVKTREMLYHSPYDPVREAEGLCASMRAEAADVIFLFGWGLGYCGKALQSRIKPGARVIVFEPNRALFALSQQVEQGKALSDSRFTFVVGGEVSRFFDDWNLQGCQDTDQFLWMEWPAAAALDGGVLESVKRKFKASLRDKAANLLTHFQKGSLYFENALANFRFHDAADAGRLFGRFADVPLVVVSAGPSLDLNVHHLRGIADRCFILAVDTALRPLLAAGITPHAIIAADPSELNARHIVGAIPDSVYLIAEQGVQPVALEAGRKRFLFGLGLFPDPLFAKFGFGKSSLNVWGSVATAALDLACRMRANPVIFAGQDFGFSWGREYASHTIFHTNTFSAQLGGPLLEPDIRGNLIHTTENLVAYRDHFVRTIRRHTGIRFINATEGGILHGPLEILELRDALDQCCREPVDVPARLSRCHRAQKPSRAALKHFLEVLRSRRRDCECLAGFLELTAKRALIEHDQNAIDARILWGIERTEQVLNQD